MLTVVIQAGGDSTRMGKDKALMPFLGTPLVQRLTERFQGMGHKILVITNQPARYQFLDLPLHSDIQPDRGALGGLLTALEVSQTEFVGLIAADMPFASPSLLIHLMKMMKDSSADAILPSSKGGPEPLHALYRRKTCLPLVKAAIQNDLWRMDAWHEDARIIILEPDETTAAAGSPHTFINLNTKSEFDSAELLARELNLY